MKKELDKELYPDYVYSIHLDPERTVPGADRETGAKRSQTGFRRNWIEKDYQKRSGTGDLPACLPMRKQNWQ